MAAIKRYNNVQLDGKPMTIELVGSNVVMSAPVPPTKSGILRAPNMASRRSGLQEFFVVICMIIIVIHLAFHQVTWNLESS